MLRVASGARTVGLTTPTPKLFEERETPRQDAVMASAERRTREQTVCSTHTHHNTPKQKQKTKIDNHSHMNHNHDELIATRCIRAAPIFKFARARFRPGSYDKGAKEPQPHLYPLIHEPLIVGHVTHA